VTEISVRKKRKSGRSANCVSKKKRKIKNLARKERRKVETMTMLTMTAVCVVNPSRVKRKPVNQKKATRTRRERRKVTLTGQTLILRTPLTRRTAMGKIRTKRVTTVTCLARARKAIANRALNTTKRNAACVESASLCEDLHFAVSAV